jgi:hypothetical protein
VAPAGVKHAFRNIGQEEAHLKVEVDPALDLQDFLEEAAALARAGLYTRRGMPTRPRALPELADLMMRYADTTVMSFPPWPIQRFLLAPFARLKHARPRRPAPPPFTSAGACSAPLDPATPVETPATHSRPRE